MNALSPKSLNVVNALLAARATPYAALAAGMVSLAAGTSFAKGLFPLVGAQGTSALRVGLSALILLAVWRPWRSPPGRADARAVLLYGLVLGLMNLSFYMSLKTIPLGLAIAIEFAGPLSLALLHSRRLIHVVWVGCAGAGLLMLLPIWGQDVRLDPAGIAYAAAAGVFWALYIVFGKRLGHMHAGRSVALGMSVAALVILPFGVAAAGPALLAPSVLAAGLIVAVASSALPYSLEMIALRHIPKRTFGVLLSAEPAVGAVAGLVLLHERLSGLQWLAIAAIVVASVGAVLTTREPPPAPDTPPASGRSVAG